eukprot:3752319-Pyramimonas_sp.AAC.1
MAALCMKSATCRGASPCHIVLGLRSIGIHARKSLTVTTQSRWKIRNSWCPRSGTTKWSRFFYWYFFAPARIKLEWSPPGERWRWGTDRCGNVIATLLP